MLNKFFIFTLVISAQVYGQITVTDSQDRTVSVSEESHTVYSRKEAQTTIGILISQYWNQLHHQLDTYIHCSEEATVKNVMLGQNDQITISGTYNGSLSLDGRKLLRAESLDQTFLLTINAAGDLINWENSLDTEVLSFGQGENDGGDPDFTLN